jgi:hypothetical protein
MAKTGARALAFVTDFEVRCRDAFARENTELEEFKARSTGSASAGCLKAWELMYWAEKRRQERYRFDEEELRPYFEVGRVQAGLFALATRVFGLRITESQADKIKTLHGRATVAAKDRNEIVWLNGDQGIGDRQFPRMTIEQITAARLREIFEIVLKKLGNLYTPGETRAGVVITGGSSVIPGLEDAAARVFEVPARIGQPRVDISENLRQGRYSTALGLLHQGLTQQVEESSSRPPGFLQKMRNVLDTISRF